MTIEDLKEKHLNIEVNALMNNKGNCEKHVELSIQFVIEVLENFDEHTQINDKIQELKQYLDEEILSN